MFVRLGSYFFLPDYATQKSGKMFITYSLIVLQAPTYGYEDRFGLVFVGEGEHKIYFLNKRVVMGS